MIKEDRIFIIHRMLKTFQEVDIESFKARFNFSTATFYRVLDELRGTYKAPIKLNNGKYSYTDRNYKLPALTMQAQELINRGLK